MPDPDLPTSGLVSGVSTGFLANIYKVNQVADDFQGWTPASIIAATPGGGGGDSDALLATADYDCTPGSGVHDNGPKLQNFLDGALATGRIHRIPAGTYLLESSNGVATNLVMDLASAVYDTTTIVFDPGAILKVPANIGVAPTYFTAASRTSTTVTLTVPSGHGIVAGMGIAVYCASPTWDFDNGDFIVTSVGATTVVYDQGSTNGTSPDTAHGGTITAYVSCFSVINGSSGAHAEIWRPQFLGPGATAGNAGVDPQHATPYTPLLGCGPRFCSRVTTHGLVSSGFYANMLIDGRDDVNTDHFHHYDIQSVSPGFYGVLLRNNTSATRDYRFDTCGLGPNQRAGIACSVGGFLPDVTFKDVHCNASPAGFLKEGFRGVALPSGNLDALFDGVHMTRTKCEGSGNFAVDACEGILEKWTGGFELHGLEINGQGPSGVNHTLRPIGLSAMTRSTTVISATYSRSSAGTSAANSPILTGLTASAFTTADVGSLLIKGDVPAGTYIMAILSTTSVLLSDDATGSSTSTCYAKPLLFVGDHLAILSANGTDLDCPAVIKTLAGTGPFTLTAEAVGSSGTVTSTTGTAGVIGGIRAGTFQHSDVTFSTQSDSSTADTASEGYWDLADADINRFTQLRNPNAQAGYSAFPSVNLRDPSPSGSLRTVMVHGSQEALLVTANDTITAGQCTEIQGGGDRGLSTVAQTKASGGYALQAAATATSHADAATQTVRPTFWVARAGQFRSTAGGQGIKVTGTVASGDLLVEDSGTPGSAVTWDGTTAGERKVGVATSADSGGFCGIEVLPGESWTF